MKALLAIALTLTGPGTEYYAGMPPARFQGPAIVKLVVVHRNELADMCGVKVQPGMILYGCTIRDWLGYPVVVIPDPCPRGELEQTARILCHELSHARGWPSNHPL